MDLSEAANTGRVASAIKQAKESIMCVIAYAVRNSALIPAAVQESIIMRPSIDPPRSDVTVTLLLFRGGLSDEGTEGTVDILHSGAINELNDDGKSIVEANWLHEIVEKGGKRKLRVVDGKVGFDPPPQFTRICPPMESTEWAVPCEANWKLTEVNDLAYVRGTIPLPLRDRNQHWFLARFSFSTNAGIQRGGRGEVLFEAYGPSQIQEKLVAQYRKVKAGTQELNETLKTFIEKFGERLFERQAEKYEVAFVGNHQSCSYELNKGDELCEEEMDFLDKPIPVSGKQPTGVQRASVFILRPKELNFFAKLRATPLLGSREAAVAGVEASALFEGVDKVARAGGFRVDWEACPEKKKQVLTEYAGQVIRQKYA